MGLNQCTALTVGRARSDKHAFQVGVTGWWASEPEYAVDLGCLSEGLVYDATQLRFHRRGLDLRCSGEGSLERRASQRPSALAPARRPCEPCERLGRSLPTCALLRVRGGVVDKRDGAHALAHLQLGALGGVHLVRVRRVLGPAQPRQEKSRARQPPLVCRGPHWRHLGVHDRNRPDGNGTGRGLHTQGRILPHVASDLQSSDQFRSRQFVPVTHASPCAVPHWT
jgi:hypothetical protein